MKKIYFTVTTDLNYDQRMQRICNSLFQAGYDVTIIGRKKRNTLPLQPAAYSQIRLNCFFQKGKFMYLEFNARLLLYLLFYGKTDIICSCDLDTIIPGYYFSKIKKIKRVYDAHEYFSELVTIAHRPLIKYIWKKIERKFVRKFKKGYTVSEFIANDLKKIYGVDYLTIRNMPLLNKNIEKNQPENDYIIFQGTILQGRHFDELLLAMKSLPLQLFIFGDGPYLNEVKIIIQRENLEKTVILKGLILPHELKYYTVNAFAGINFNADEGLSNRFSLTNRFFDYMHAGIPQLCSDLPAYREINKEYEIAILMKEVTPSLLSHNINLLINDKLFYERLRQNCLLAKEKYNWQNEEKKLISFYNELK